MAIEIGTTTQFSDRTDDISELVPPQSILDSAVFIKDGVERTIKLQQESLSKASNSINELIKHFNFARGNYWSFRYYPYMVYDTTTAGIADENITNEKNIDEILKEICQYAIRELSLPSRRNNIYDININGVKQKAIADFDIDAISITLYNDAENKNLTKLYEIFNNYRVYRAGHILNKYPRQYYGMVVISFVDRSQAEFEIKSENNYYLHHAFIESIDDVRLDIEGGDIMQITFTLQFSNVITGLYLGDVR